MSRWASASAGSRKSSRRSSSPDFDKRGAVTDEWLAIFKQLWTQSPASFKGQFYNYNDIRAEPFPLQKPHPPIWVGGHSRAALRRTARHGDGWHPVGAIAASPLPPVEMRTLLASLKQMTAAEGRDFDKLTISYKAPLYDTGVPDRDGARRSFSGTPQQIAGDIRSFAGIGVHELIFDFRGQSLAESLEGPAALRGGGHAANLSVTSFASPPLGGEAGRGGIQSPCNPLT